MFAYSKSAKVESIELMNHKCGVALMSLAIPDRRTV